MADPEIVKRLQADAIFFGTRQEPLLVDDAVCREMAECWEIAANEIERLREDLEDTKIQLANMEEDYFRIREHNE